MQAGQFLDPLDERRFHAAVVHSHLGMVSARAGRLVRRPRVLCHVHATSGQDTCQAGQVLPNLAGSGHAPDTRRSSENNTSGRIRPPRLYLVLRFVGGSSWGGLGVTPSAGRSVLASRLGTTASIAVPPKWRAGGPAPMLCAWFGLGRRGICGPQASAGRGPACFWTIIRHAHVLAGQGSQGTRSADGYRR